MDRSSLIVAVGTVAASAMVAAGISSWVQRPEPQQELNIGFEITPPRTAVVVQTQLADRQILFGTVRDVADVVSIEPDERVVTAAPVWDGSVDRVALELGGRPLFVVEGEFPLWRDLAPGDRGPDVEIIESWLARSGTFDKTHDQTFDKATSAAITELYETAGYQPPPTIGNEEVTEAGQSLAEATTALESAERQLSDFDEDQRQGEATESSNSTEGDPTDDVATDRERRDLQLAVESAKAQVEHAQQALSVASQHAGVQLPMNEVVVVTSPGPWRFRSQAGIGDHFEADFASLAPVEGRTVIDFEQATAAEESGDGDDEGQEEPSSPSQPVCGTEFPLDGELLLPDGSTVMVTVVDSEPGACMVEANDTPLPLGDRIRIDLVYGRSEAGALALPINAVKSDQSGAYVDLITADGDVQRRDVGLGVRQGDLIEIVADGLQAGDLVGID